VVEELYGSARFLFLYMACGVGGSLFSSYFGKAPSVGASGAILGLAGILIAVTTKRGGAQIREMRSRLISWVLTIFLLGYFFGGIDSWGHLGGLAIGFGLGKLFEDREPRPGAEQSRAYVLGWMAGAVAVAAFVMMFLHFGDRLPPWIAS
jgi:rhomboid protease GluP